MASRIVFQPRVVEGKPMVYVFVDHVLTEILSAPEESEAMLMDISNAQYHAQRAVGQRT